MTYGTTYQNRKRNALNKSLVFKIIAYLLAGITAAALIGVVIYILAQGLPHLSWSFLFGRYEMLNAEPMRDALGNIMRDSEGSIMILREAQMSPSVFPSIVATLMMVGISLLIAIPLGIAAAIFLAEYTKPGSRIVKYIRMATDALTGVPSIVYGMFGSLFFVLWMGMGTGVLAASLTMSIVLLPVTIRATEESIKTIPLAYREGSYGLGARKHQTVFKIVLPGAMPGIVTSVILGAGRVIGESAIILLTAGGLARVVPTSLTESTTNLAGSIWNWSLLPDTRGAAAATAVIILFLVIILNITATLVGRRLSRNRGGNG